MFLNNYDKKGFGTLLFFNYPKSRLLVKCLNTDMLREETALYIFDVPLLISLWEQLWGMYRPPEQFSWSVEPTWPTQGVWSQLHLGS